MSLDQVKYHYQVFSTLYPYNLTPVPGYHISCVVSWTFLVNSTSGNMHCHWLAQTQINISSPTTLSLGRVFAHNGIQGLARDGQPLRQEVVHYPHNSTTYSTAYQEPAAVSVQSIARFPTVMIPFDRVHVRTISSSPSPPVQVCVVYTTWLIS